MELVQVSTNRRRHSGWKKRVKQLHRNAGSWHFATYSGWLFPVYTNTQDNKQGKPCRAALCDQTACTTICSLVWLFREIFRPMCSQKYKQKKKKKPFLSLSFNIRILCDLVQWRKTTKKSRSAFIFFSANSSLFVKKQKTIWARSGVVTARLRCVTHRSIELHPPTPIYCWYATFLPRKNLQQFNGNQPTFQSVRLNSFHWLWQRREVCHCPCFASCNNP